MRPSMRLSSLALLSLSALPLATAQDPNGPITISVIGSACVAIGQITVAPTPDVLERAAPLCPGEKRAIKWPLTSAGEGAASHFALYAGISNGKPGCAVGLGPEQVGYLRGRTLEWREKEGHLYDVTADGVLLDTDTWQPIAW